MNGNDKRRAACIAFGFASYKTAQSFLYSTGMFTSDTTTILIAGLDFSIASALFVIATEIVVITAALTGRLPSFSMPALVPSAILAATASLSFSGMFELIDTRFSLLIVTAAQGTATVLLTLAWTELLTKMNTASSMKILASAMLLAAISTSLMQFLPTEVVLPCILALLLMGAILFYRSKSLVLKGEDTAPPLQKSSAPIRPYIRHHMLGLVAIGEGLLSLLVLGCTVGIINGFMVAQGYNFAGSSSASALGNILASMVFFVMAYALPRTFSASKAYRMLFPLLTAVLIAWPFANFQYSYFVGTAFVAGHSLIATSVMYLIIHEAHDEKLNPYAFMGASVLLIRLSSVIGLIAGALIASLDIQPSFKTMLVFCVALYVLSIALLFMLRVRKRQEGVPVGMPQHADDQDSFTERTAQLTASAGLTQRESDILTLLARGRSATYIGQVLYLSPNTVRGHIKNIYAKLGVHSKQEIIDLFSA